MNQELNSCVATVGFFDGVHAGHRFLIDELKAIAKAQNKKSVVITFATHPRKVLDAAFKPELLNALSEKIALLESTGIDSCIVLDFTPEMAKLSAYEFIKTVLWEKYNVSTLLVGHDHRFGHNRTDGFAEYKKYGESLGMTVIQEKQYFTAEFTNICSSEVRLALLRGEIETANKIPVPLIKEIEPEPIAPMRSAKIVRIPMQIPPKLAATGMYLLRMLNMLESR
jgi:riboflavin kinase/FMN adenylyltransferase